MLSIIVPINKTKVSYEYKSAGTYLFITWITIKGKLFLNLKCFSASERYLQYVYYRNLGKGKRILGKVKKWNKHLHYYSRRSQAPRQSLCYFELYFDGFTSLIWNSKIASFDSRLKIDSSIIIPDCDLQA